MNEIRNTFLKAIFGGASIGIGGVIYLSLENHVAGAFLFSLGLFTIYAFNLSLYTGKVCFIPNKKWGYLIEVAVVLLGNIVGTVGLGYLLRTTKLIKLHAVVDTLAQSKLADSYYSAFIMGILCGFMMCIAVIGYQILQDGVGKHLALILPIMVFILAGFEHSIADLFYFSFSNAWNAHAVILIAVIALGNMVGGTLLPLLARFTEGRRLGCDI